MQQHSGHTIKAFDEDIERLRGLIGEMGDLAHKAIREAMRCASALSDASSARIDALTIDPERSPMSRISRWI
jgi:phosphate transport system protein